MVVAVCECVDLQSYPRHSVLGSIISSRPFRVWSPLVKKRYWGVIGWFRGGWVLLLGGRSEVGTANLGLDGECHV
jgi:hypothetical protein